MLLKEIKQYEDNFQHCLRKVSLINPFLFNTNFFGYRIFIFQGRLYSFKNEYPTFDSSKTKEYLSGSDVKEIAFKIIDSLKNTSHHKPLIIDKAYGRSIFQFKSMYIATKKDNHLNMERLDEYDSNVNLDELYEILFQYHINSIEVFIHTGLPKTATTFLQKNIFPNLKGIHYISKYGSNNFFDKFFLKIRFGNHLFICDKIRKQFMEYIRYIDASKILISEESLSEPRNNGRYFQPNTLILKELFSSVKIIYTIRYQIDFLESFYLQDLRVGGCLSIDSFLRYNKRKNKFEELEYTLIPKLSVYYLDYRVFIDYYLKLFGKNNVKVLIYEKLKNDKEEFLREMYLFLGTEYYEPKNNDFEHKSFGHITSYMALALNKLTYREDGKPALFFERPFVEILDAMVADLEKSLQNMNKRFLAKVILRVIIKTMSFLRKLLYKLYINTFLDKIDTLLNTLTLNSKRRVINGEKRKILRTMYNQINRNLDKKYALGLQKYNYYD